MVELDRIYRGDALSITKSFPDCVFDCIITSPPYWGLRDYQTEPLIWDGDSSCSHEWVDKSIKWHSDRGKGNSGSGCIKEVFDNNFQVSGTQSGFCSLCGAWRGSLGLEPSFQLYITHLIQIFDECGRVLKDTGVLWVNLGDSYATHLSSGQNSKGQFGIDMTCDSRSQRFSKRQKQTVQEKSLCDIPFRFSIAMIDRGWVKRNTIIWHKRNAMPSSARDRFTVDFEYVFMFVKQGRYYFEQQFEPLQNETLERYEYGYNDTEKRRGLRETGMANHELTKTPPANGRNKRCVWNIPTKSFKEAHFATFPEELVTPMIKSGCPDGGIVYDPFMGSGTVAVVAKKLNRHYVGSELNADYIAMGERRIKSTAYEPELFGR